MARVSETEDRSGNGPMERLKAEVGGLVDALGERALTGVREKVEGATDRLTGYVDQGAGPGLIAAATGAKGLAEGKSPVRAALGAGVKGVTEKVRQAFGGGKGGGKGKKMKVTNIVESIDVGVPIRLAYNQWTQFTDFPSFMKKVENVEQEEDQKLNWKAQVLWSHRDWESTILEQIPDDRIVWRSKGAKGYVDGAVTFHELAPNLTRILLVLEYHPQGFFERTGNLWRAQGRRARLELKHFRRHVMSEAILHPDEIEGWRGVIKDGEVVKDHETALEEEQESEGRGGEEGEEPEDEFAGEERGEEGEEDEEGREEEDQEELVGSSENGEEPQAGRRRARAGQDDGGPERGRRPAGRPQRSSRTEDRPQRTARRTPARGR